MPILVVDDSLTTRMLEQSILESAGYEVDVALSGEDALDRVRGKRYALILVDVEMPGMDGFTLIEHLRSDPDLRATPAMIGYIARSTGRPPPRRATPRWRARLHRQERVQSDRAARHHWNDWWAIMAKTRVLVVEDSATIRQRLIEIPESDPEIELVGAAEDGKQAVELCQRHRPDVITMDMALPIMSGLTATEYIMAHFPTPILVVSASINRGELFKIYDALAAGAVDVLEKPTGYEPPGEWERHFLWTVKLVARIRVIRSIRARFCSGHADYHRRRYARRRNMISSRSALPPAGPVRSCKY